MVTVHIQDSFRPGLGRLAACGQLSVMLPKGAWARGFSAPNVFLSKGWSLHDLL